MSLTLVLMDDWNTVCDEQFDRVGAAASDRRGRDAKASPTPLDTSN